MFTKMFNYMLLVSIIILLYFYVYGKYVNFDNRHTLKNYVRVDTVPENIMLAAERYKFNPTMFNIPKDFTQPVEPREYIPKKINEDGTCEYEFLDNVFVKQLQLVGDFAIQHDGNGNFIFYKKK